MAWLHNVTVYVTPDQFGATRAFYADELALPVVFEEPGHICCVGVGPELAICIHEAEPGHPAGTRELFLWVDDAGAGPEIRLVDPVGTHVRLHRRQDLNAGGTSPRRGPSR